MATGLGIVSNAFPANEKGYGGSFLATVRNLSFALGTAFFSGFLHKALHIIKSLKVIHQPML